jgi:hypothetical protein
MSEEGSFSFLSNDKKEDTGFSFLGTDSTSGSGGFTFFGGSENKTEDKEEKDGEEGEVTSTNVEEECNATFKPLVDLKELPEIEVKTNEEDEDIFYSV